ncbi:hypothetical protein D2E25_0096 [Bifidobacterium goeldii]|uniref:Uncharacterized protein n=1 Tax=Bifidobacterium goeldii TaxID=2306975 RepID=A0A430FLY2_9BIFI|nr:hypothetical protein [Bifidobacterium goeldii]RSX53790.1 hypothetical protein D2E25_0096 [Bifidobacterium goeldii]
MYDQAAQSARHAREKMTPETLCAWLRYNFPGLLKDGVVFDPDMRIPKGSEIEKQLGHLHTLRMNQLLKQAAKSHPDTVRLWAKHAGEYYIINTKYTGTAEFDPKAGGIRVNLKKIGLDGKRNRAYETMFHETSHMLDWILGDSRQYGSYGYHTAEFPMLLQNDAVALHKTAKKELIRERPNLLMEVAQYDAYLKRNSRLNRAQLKRLYDEGIIQGDYMQFYGSGHAGVLRTVLSNWRSSIEAEPTDQQILTRMRKKVHEGMLDTDGAVDDMIFAQYDGYRGFVWHPPRDPKNPIETKYFKSGMMRSAEAWAEMLAAQIANPQAWNHIQKWFPQSSKLLDEMIQEAFNG